MRSLLIFLLFSICLPISAEIQPQLLEALRTADEPIDAIIVFSPIEGGDRLDLQAIKAPFHERIQRDADRLREIVRQPFGTAPLTEAFPVFLSDLDRIEIRDLRAEIDLTKTEMVRTVARAIEESNTGRRQLMESVALDAGALEPRTSPMGRDLTAKVTLDVVKRLAEDPRIVWIGLSGRAKLDTDISIPSAGFTTFHNNGFIGSSADAGIIDSGVQMTHPSFAGLNFHGDPAADTDTDGHGTHVAATMLGRSSPYLGGAYGVQDIVADTLWLVFFDFKDKTWDLMTEYSEVPDVINHSASYTEASGTYMIYDEWIDGLVEAFGVLWVNSAGNSGWDPGSNVGSPGLAYNGFAVANMNDQNTVSRADDVRNTSSSVGSPMGFDRKPDIAAPGTAIVSANYEWWDSLWLSQSGTSMAAPHVAAAGLLLEDWGNVSHLSQKAVLINTADWWTSNGTQGIGDDGPNPTPATPTDYIRWDRSYGWGYLNMNTAFLRAGDYFLDSVVPENNTPTEDDFKLYAGAMAPLQKATLVFDVHTYTDFDPIWGSVQLGYPANELSLWIYNETNNAPDIVYDEQFDNVMQVTPTYTIPQAVLKVQADEPTFDGVSSEPFAIAVPAGFQEVGYPDQFRRFYDGPTSVEPGEEFDIEVWIESLNSIASHNHIFNLVMPAGWTLVSGADPRELGTVLADEESTHAIWRVRAPDTPIGSQTLRVVSSHHSYGVASNTQDIFFNVTVEWDTSAPQPSPLTWNQEPYDGAPYTRMEATTASDTHGVEYQFTFTGSPTGGALGSSSPWQDSPSYIDLTGSINHQYCYRAQARDKAAAQNVTGSTPISCDFTPIDPASGVEIVEVGVDWVDMRSLNTPDGLDRGLSGLRYEVQHAGGSAWIPSNQTYRFGGLSPSGIYNFRVRSRNGDGEATTPSSWTEARTLAAPPVLSSLHHIDATTIRITLSTEDGNGTAAYEFLNQTNGDRRDWSPGQVWYNIDLTCGLPYTYYARARNIDEIPTAWTFMGTHTIPVGTDVDGDGFGACNGECDDDNPNVNPNGFEFCDGIDNNCSGEIDENYANTDGDGLADCVDPDDEDRALRAVPPAAADLRVGLALP